MKKRRLALSILAVTGIVAAVQFSVFSQEPQVDAFVPVPPVSSVTMEAVADVNGSVVIMRDGPTGDLVPQPSLDSGGDVLFRRSEDGHMERVGQPRGNVLLGQANPPATVERAKEPRRDAFYYNNSDGSPAGEEQERRVKHRTLEVAINRLVGGYASSTDEAKRTEIKAALVKNIEEQFALKQDAREEELKALEEQVKKLRDLQNQRQAQKDRIVNDRVQQLLNDAQGLGWGSVEGKQAPVGATFNLKGEGWTEGATNVRPSDAFIPAPAAVRIEAIPGAVPLAPAPIMSNPVPARAPQPLR